MTSSPIGPPFDSDELFAQQSAKRCPWAIKFGAKLTTRCQWDLDHEGSHLGHGLAEFSYQTIEWFPGDRREFRTDRRDHFAWEQ